MWEKFSISLKPLTGWWWGWDTSSRKLSSWMLSTDARLGKCGASLPFVIFRRCRWKNLLVVVCNWRAYSKCLLYTVLILTAQIVHGSRCHWNMWNSVTCLFKLGDHVACELQFRILLCEFICTSTESAYKASCHHSRPQVFLCSRTAEISQVVNSRFLEQRMGSF